MEPVVFLILLFTYVASVGEIVKADSQRFAFSSNST